MDSRVRTLTLAFVFAIVGAPQVVHAAAPKAAAEKSTARALLDEGKVRREKGDLKGALESFKAADAIMHVPTTGMFVAKTQLALGQLIEARDTALSVTQVPVGKKEPAAFKSARGAAEQLASELEARIPTLRVRLRPEGQTADVTIDDAAVPTDALATGRRVNPGHHVIIAKAGDQQKQEVADLAEKDNKEVTIDFAPPPPEAPVVATTTKDPATGTAAEPAPTKRKTSPLVYIGFGLAGAGLIAGTIGGIETLSMRSSLDTGCRDFQCPPGSYDDLDGARTWATVSTIGFVAAGVGGVIGVIGLVASPKAESSVNASPEKRAQGFRVTPTAVAVPRGAGLGASGVF
jgi:hypothetical protein